MTKPEPVSDTANRARASIEDAIRIVAGRPVALGVVAAPSRATDTTSIVDGAAQAMRQAR